MIPHRALTGFAVSGTYRLVTTECQNRTMKAVGAEIFCVRSSSQKEKPGEKCECNYLFQAEKTCEKAHKKDPAWGVLKCQ